MERLTYEKSRSVWDRGKYPSKYTSRHTFQEVVARLAAYEDTGLEPKDIDALQKREQGLAELRVNISCGCAVTYSRLEELARAEKDGRLAVLPPNDPLTLEELREMGGEPLYIVSGKFKDWRIPDFIDEGAYKGFVRFTDRSAEPMNDYGKTWLAYRRKSEEGNHENFM